MFQKKLVQWTNLSDFVSYALKTTRVTRTTLSQCCIGVASFNLLAFWPALGNSVLPDLYLKMGWVSFRFISMCIPYFSSLPDLFFFKYTVLFDTCIAYIWAIKHLKVKRQQNNTSTKCSLQKQIKKYYCTTVHVNLHFYSVLMYVYCQTNWSGVALSKQQKSCSVAQSATSGQRLESIQKTADLILNWGKIIAMHWWINIFTHVWIRGKCPLSKGHRKRSLIKITNFAIVGLW